MNKFKLLSLLFLALSLYSCGTLTEEIKINEDGSGEYKAYANLIPGIAEFVKLQISESDPDLDLSKPELNDSLKLMFQEMFWRDLPDEVDSTLDLSKEIPDSIFSNPEYKDIINKLSGFLRGNKDELELNTGLEYRFDNDKDLTSLFDFLRQSQVNETQSGSIKAYVSIEIKGSKVIRKTKIPKSERLPDSEIEKIEQMVSEGKVRTVVYLPRKVKKVKGDCIVKTEDKVVVIEYNLLEYLKGEVNTDFEITMEKK
ncbi:MAG: hypothetical protein AAFX87_20690 [Bacteroidota bacterium]